jgi:hypothetical protein
MVQAWRQSDALIIALELTQGEGAYLFMAKLMVNPTTPARAPSIRDAIQVIASHAPHHSQVQGILNGFGCRLDPPECSSYIGR